VLGVLWPTLTISAVALTCLTLWATQPDLQRSEPLRVVLIVATCASVLLGLVAAVEIVGRILAFGFADAFES
jgi:hypothetical protein